MSLRGWAAGAVLLLQSLAPSVAAAPDPGGWSRVLAADSNLDLRTAEELALATVADDPRSAAAVAVAGWWIGNLDVLPEPESLQSAGGAERDPELGFLLERVAAELGGHPPAGTLTPVELSGPWGLFDTLDLERDVVPADADLPPLPTPWRAPAGPFRLRIESGDGWAEPPRAMVAGGVYLAAWSLEVADGADGWLVVEGNGSLDLELDGRRVVELRDCGTVDPAESWLRVRLEAGAHRLRVEMASREVPGVRLSLLDGNGAPLGGVAVVERADPPWAASVLEKVDPPASAELAARLHASDADLDAGLTAVALARGRGDPRREGELLRGLLTSFPDSELVYLEAARYYLVGTTGLDGEENLRRVREHLRSCQGLAMSGLMARVVAAGQRRPEDAERILETLVAEHPRDPRVAQVWIRHALERSWLREAADALEPLVAALPRSRQVIDLELDVLAALERWGERTELLLELAATTPPSLELAERLAEVCRRDAAMGVLDELARRVQDPAVGLATARLLIADGRVEEAGTVLEAIRARWGDLAPMEPLRLAVSAETGGDLDALLAAALERTPADLGLRTLAWQRGLEPFWRPYRVDALRFAAGREASSEGIDAELLLDQAVERVYPDGSSIYYYHGLTRALTPAGAAQAGRLQQMPSSVLLDVKIHKPDGTVIIPPELPGGGGSLELSDVKAGDLVEEEYVSALAGIGGGRRGHLSPYIYRFADADRAFGLSEYMLLVPPEIDLSVDGMFEGLQREESSTDGLEVLRWRSEEVPPVPTEPLAPPAQELLPWVSYGFGVTWQDVGDAVRDRILATFVGSDELEEWAEPQLEGHDLEERLASLVDATVGEVEAGRSQLELGTTVGESFSRREGNRLGIVAFLLVRAGLEVDLALSRPLPLARSHLEVPTMEAFGQPVLRVRRGDETVWVDLDEERRGVGHISPLLQGSDALLIPLDDPRRPVSYLDRLPVFPNPELEDRRRVHAVLDASGEARVEVELVLRGGAGQRLSEQVESLPSERVQMLYVQVAVGLLPGAENVTGSVGRDGDEVRLTLGLDLPGACEGPAGRQVCRGLVIHRPLVPALASLPQRRFPLVLQLPISQRHELVLELPSGWTMDRGPRLLEARWGSVREELEITDGRVHSVLRLEIPAQVVAPEEYPEFARFCHAVDELMSRPPTLVAR